MGLTACPLYSWWNVKTNASKLHRCPGASCFLAMLECIPHPSFVPLPFYRVFLGPLPLLCEPSLVLIICKQLVAGWYRPTPQLVLLNPSRHAGLQSLHTAVSLFLWAGWSDSLGFAFPSRICGCLFIAACCGHRDDASASVEG